MGSILASLDNGASIEALLTPLFVATWAKWLAIAGALGAIGVGWWRSGRRALAVPVLVVLPMTVLAMATGNPLVSEALGGAVVLGFVVAFGHAFVAD